jgi:hypothetical protein
MPTKKLTGDLAQTSVGAPVTVTGTTTSASTSVTAVSSIAGLAVGQAISGTGIASATTIAAVSGSTITLSAAATASGTVSLTVAAEVQVIGLSEWTIDFKLKTADATTTDDSAWESSLPSTKSWTAKAKYIYLEGDPSQIAQIRAVLAQTPSVAMKWNFFPDPVNGDDGFSGMAFIDGITWNSGIGKIVGQDVSLKGTGPLTTITQAAPIPNAATLTDLQAEV